MEPNQNLAIATAEPAGSLSFVDSAKFEHIQRVAKMFAGSTLVPESFKGNLPNCVIALEMAHRMSASPLAVMQSMNIIHGKPGFSAAFVVGMVNTCGRFAELEFQMTGTPGKDDRGCFAWTVKKGSEARLEGPPVTVQMAKDEGWFGKAGSKWKTMPELMLRYRAAAFWQRVYAPELTLGMRTTEEIIDIDATVETKKPIEVAKPNFGVSAPKGSAGAETPEARIPSAEPTPSA